MLKAKFLNGILKAAGVSAFAFHLSACSFIGYVSSDMTVSLTNDSNMILFVEGRTDLPDGMPVRLSLKEQDKSVCDNKIFVKNGKFCGSLDLSSIPGNSALMLDITADPSEASEEVQDIVGSRGEKLIGEQLEDINGCTCAVKRMSVAFPMSRQEVAVRRIRSGDYNLGISALEKILENDPGNETAKAWLAYALLNRDSGENSIGSKAYSLLHSINLKKLPEPLRASCSEWMNAWNIKEEKDKQERARKKAIARTKALMEAKKKAIEPGIELGGVYIGATAQQVYKLCIPDKYPEWTDGVVYYKMPDRDVEVFFDSQTGFVIQAHTSNTLYALKGNIGVGSKVESVKKYFPRGRMDMGDEKAQKDGSILSFGKYSCPEGIIFEIKRLTDKYGVLMSERVCGMSIVAPFTVDLSVPDDSAAEEGESSDIDLGSGAYPKSEEN